MRKRQQTEEQRAGAHLLHAKGDGRRLLGKGLDENGGQPVQQRANRLRDDDRAQNAEPRALPGAPQLARAQVLPDEGGNGRGKAGNGQEGEALHLGIGAAAAHGHLAKGIDIGLHHYIGQRDDGILQTAGQTIGEDHTGHFRVKADLPPFHLAFAGNGVHQPPHAQEHADELRNDGGQRRAVHIHLKDGDKQNIQHHIGDGGDDKIIKRMAAVAHRLHHAAALVVHHQTDAAREVGADIGD